MAVTDDPALAERMRLMSLHGLSQDAWERYSGGKTWDYRIVAPGYKYNLTDVAAAIGIHQLARAEADAAGAGSRSRGDSTEAFADVEELETPADDPDRIHSWHLFPIRLRLDRLAIDRNAFMEGLKEARRGVFRALAAAAPASLLSSDLRLAARGPSRRDIRLGAARQPADLPRNAAGGSAARR